MGREVLGLEVSDLLANLGPDFLRDGSTVNQVCHGRMVTVVA